MAREFHTIFRSAKLPWTENETSRRYLHILHRWVPSAISYFDDWPIRPNCGYFYGGCAWYGEETCSPAFVFALVASSPEYDPSLTGRSRHALRAMAYKALRYLLFTHDTGPADCVRPVKGLGHQECCGNKWGERGRGFFMESQCGVTLGQMAITALLLNDLLDDETWTMLETLFGDYANRFASMEPKNGVYLDTQMEENAWTSLGLASSALFLGHHPMADTWLESARRWMFLTVSSPQDAKNRGRWQDGKRISELVGKTFTALPDYMAENHGMVHPTYTASSMTFLLNLAVLYNLFSVPLPAEALYNRDEIYKVLKRLSDRAGMMHPVQGMDWPYLRTSEPPLPHTAAALILHDPDAAHLELLVLERAEQVMESNEGRMYHRDIGERVSNIQDPLIMWEYQAFNYAYGYAAHRLMGPAPTPTPISQFETAQSGVRVFPHSGFIFHRHPRGQTSFSWRNTVMALPLNADGVYTMAPATGSILAQFEVQDYPDSQHLVSLAYDEYQDRFALNLVMERCQNSLRQRVMFASLPDGTSLVIERLEARRNITVNYVKQGFIRLINENYCAMPDNCRGQRTLYSGQGDQLFNSYVTVDPKSDIEWQASNPGWLNLDDRMGIVFKAQGPTLYLNRHYFSPWWAVADDLYLGQQLTPHAYQAGEQVAQLDAVFCPGQTHAETDAQQWQVLDGAQGAAVALITNGYLAAANWGAEELSEPYLLANTSSSPIAIPVGETVITPEQIAYHLVIKANGASLRRIVGQLYVKGSVEIEASEQGQIWIRNISHELVKVERVPSLGLVSLAPGQVTMIEPSR